MDITDEMRRHSAAHLTARAIMSLFDNVQVDIGPATDEGFYYDFDLEHRLSPEDFPKIEAEVARLIALDEPFVQKDVTADEARQKNHVAQARMPCFQGTRWETPVLPLKESRFATYQS